MVQVRSATPTDAPVWLRLRQALWPEHEGAGHAGEIEQFLAGRLQMFASDALLDNVDSAAAHRALGFQETVQIRCFRKSLA